MQNYEVLYIVSSQFTEAELPKIRTKVDEILIKYGAVIGYQESMGKRKLAYPIDKQAHGYYIITEFELEDGSKIEKINTDLKLDKDIVRAQIIAKPKITKEEIEHRHRAERVAEEGGERKAPTATDGKKKNLDEKLDEILQNSDVSL